MNYWLNHHIQAIHLVLKRMQYNVLSTLMICTVIGVALCIPGLFYLGVDNLSKLTNHMQDETEISLFLKLDNSNDTVTEVGEALAKNTLIKHYRLVTKDEAWQQLKSKAETGSEANSPIAQLNKNPLPDAFFIQSKTSDPADLETLRSSLQEIPGVEQALLNTEWAKRLSLLLQIGKKVIFFIAALLALALLIIIGNTVRMQILTQKDEIEVSKLMGATSSFIRTPFLYAGIFYGLFGGLLAIAMITCVITIFNQSIAQISNLYNSDFSLTMLNYPMFFTILISAIFIGWLGSYFAVNRSIAGFKIN